MLTIEDELNKVKAVSLHNKKLLFMGRMEHVKQMIAWAKLNHYQIEAILDNDVMKKGLLVDGVEVFLPQDKLLPYLEEFYIIIYSPKYWEVMLEQLEKYGYIEGVHICVLNKPSALRNISLIRRGCKIYKKIKKEFGRNVQIFLANCPLGDYYLLCLFFWQYCEVKGIEKYVIVGTSVGIDKLSPLFGINNTKRLNLEDSEALICAWSFLGAGRIRMKPLTIWQGAFRFNPCVTRLLGDFTFLDTFRYMIFNLPEGTIPQYPKRVDNKNAIRQFFQDNRLLQGKTVIVCPFSYSLESLSNEFWIRLTEQLLAYNFTIAVNVSGKEENFIPNTITMRMDFAEMMDAMEYAGTVVGMRSGFFDITSQADCTRVIIYPKTSRQKVSWNSTGIEFVGLKNMGLCKDAYEWEIEEEQVLIDKVVKVLIQD